MYQDERRLDFHALGREIKRKREAKGWTQEYLAQLVDRTPRSILQSINGMMASINSTHKTASQQELYHLAKVRFETDPRFESFSKHEYFEKYISGKTESLIFMPWMR